MTFMTSLGQTTLVLFISSFFVVTLVHGVKFNMKVSGLSSGNEGFVFQTTHETLAKLIKRSSELRMSCEGQRSPCVRPIDYSHLKSHIPVRMEACKSGEKLPDCDDVKLELSVNTRDLLLTGFLK